MPSAMNGPTKSFPLVITSARGLTGRSVGHSSTQKSHRSDMGTAGSGEKSSQEFFWEMTKKSPTFPPGDWASAEWVSAEWVPLLPLDPSFST